MSTFDLIVNFIESFIFVLFIYLVFEKRKGFMTFVIFYFIYTLIMYMFKSVLLPKIVLNITSFIILFIYTVYLQKNNILANSFICLFVRTLNDISITTSILITNELFGYPFYSGYSYVCLTVTLNFIFIFLVFISYFYIQMYHFLETKKLKYLLFSILILELLFTSITDFIFYQGILDSYIKNILIFINLLSLFLFVIVIETQKEQQYLLSLQRDKLSLETQEKIQSLNNENISELNKWKHDMNHVLNAIQYKMNHQEYDKANQIINQMNNHLNQTQIIMKTNNDLLDHLLLQKYDLLKKHDMTLLTSYNTCICPLEDTHFCIILGNLLNNAIENCKGEHKFIYLLIEPKARYYHIEIKNTINESVLEKNPYLITQKQDKEKHGVGLKSVRLLVDRYHGKISFHEQSGYFIVNIIIPNS